MSFDTLRQDIEQRMATNWAQSAPVAYENLPFVPPSGPWVRFTAVNGAGITAGLGGSGAAMEVLDTGMVSLQVFTQEGKGSKIARQLIDAFVAIFEHQAFNGITTYSTTVTPAGTNNGWYQVNATIPFRRFR